MNLVPDEMDLEEVLEYRSIKKLPVKDVEIKIDFNIKNKKLEFMGKRKEEYFTFKKDNNILDKLSMVTKGVIYDLGMRITHSGFLTYENGNPIRTQVKLREFTKLKEHTWKKIVWKELKEFNIIRKEKIRNRWYFVMNPLFSVKDRTITDYTFICFHKEIKEYISDIDYLYLKKTLGINPNK